MSILLTCRCVFPYKLPASEPVEGNVACRLTDADRTDAPGVRLYGANRVSSGNKRTTDWINRFDEPRGRPTSAALNVVSWSTRGLGGHLLTELIPLRCRQSSYIPLFTQDVWEAATICLRPCKLTFEPLTLKVVSESRVTWATSVPILVFPGLSVLDLGPMCASDRQTSDVRHASLLNASALWGRGHKNLNLIAVYRYT